MSAKRNPSAAGPSPVIHHRHSPARVFSARSLISILAAALVVSLWLYPTHAGKWKGQMVEKDGIVHAVNPSEGMEAAKTVELEELWRVGGETDDEDEFFGVITQILSDDRGSIYLLDGQLSLVKIFSEDGEFIREIGREGEGPGEFRSPTGMFFTEDGNLGVMQVAPGKIVLLTPEGEPAGEYPLPTPEDGGFLILLGGQSNGDNVVLAVAKNAFAEGRFDQTRYLCSIDREGNEIARYHEEVRTIDFANPVMEDTQWDTFDRRWTVASDGRVYAVTSYLGYSISVWKPDGKLDRVIELEHELRKRTEEEAELVENIMSLFTRQIPNGKVKINEYVKDIESIFVRDDGSLWVISSEGSRDMPEGSLGIFDVFDRDGHFVRRVTLMGEGNPMTDGYYFVGDRLYVVTDLLQAALSLQAGGEPFEIGEEEPEPMGVICYKLAKELRISMR